MSNQERIGRWYFGGLSASMAATFTHPLDLVKVIMQTPSVEGAKKLTLIGTTVNIIKTQGFLSLYNGLTASWLRQMTYSLTRFGIYETMKQHMVTLDDRGKPMKIPFTQTILLAGVSGAAGGFVGTPGDVILVRMQNDVKLPLDQRRNYKHALDGVFTATRRDGFRSLFQGSSMATSRAVLVTIGQLAMYDQFKYLLLHHVSSVFSDNLVTHFTSSLLAGATATTLTMPLDVMKTRMMNAKPGEYKSISHCAGTILKSNGPMGFFKGFIPAFVRLAPHTILMFVFLEQIRMRFGYLPTAPTSIPSSSPTATVAIASTDKKGL